MTALDLAVDEELASPFEPCLKEKITLQHRWHLLV
jgi:hypothetical protein